MTNAPPKEEKIPRFRSAAYPSLPLSKAIERTASLYGKALHHSVPISVAASAWEYAEKSSGLFATVAALKQFGLIGDDGSGEKRRIKLTESAMRIVRDADPNSEKRKSAIRGAALAPKIHSLLWEKYGAAGVSGAMDVVLKSYLTLDRADDGEAPYSDSSADDLIAQYRSTMTFAGLVESSSLSSEQDYSQDKANLDLSEGDGPMHATPPQLPNQASTGRATLRQATAELNDINVEFSGGKIRINAVLDMEGLEKLEKKIAVLKQLMN